ncbi:hypothetical protein SNE33_09405 [Lysobacter zhanggongensis]|uniref:Uncharacterized protein n=1 Tax=Lysobacter zhanggongensis TaxID=1774951 RepID=A0ABU7YRA2_9GAMM
MTALQPLEVIGQLHGATHEHRAGVVAVGDLAVHQRQGEALHLLGHHRRGIQLDHAQRAVHLVQVPGAGAHPVRIVRRLDVGLDLLPRLAQGLVEFGLDPAERGGVDCVAHHGHHPPRRSAEPCHGQRRPGVRQFIDRSNPRLKPAA